MCGIVGFVSEKPTDKSFLFDMNSRLRHRGPDAEGYFQDATNRVGLGHRRLSILDLSENGNQPFFSRCGRYVMVFNGEVYNFRSLAKKYDIKQKTGSDSEVVIECFSKLGTDCLKEFNGMFSIAIWDREEERLTLVRDRLGIKPLVYYRQGNSLFFCSEIKTFFETGLNCQLNRGIIPTYLHLGFIPHPYTIIENCFKLPPGSVGVLENGELKIRHFWSIKDKLCQPEAEMSEEGATLRFKRLLDDSVRLRLISDVPVGSFLSGGIDSSLVTALAKKNATGKLKTFSMCFKNKVDDEAKYAKKVADYLGTDHREFVFSESDIVQMASTMMEHYDEPFSDTSSLPMMLICEKAKQEVTVCLSGDGGDELFMGYGAYDWADRLSNPVVRSLRRMIGYSLRLSPFKKHRRNSEFFQFGNHENILEHIASQDRGQFSTMELAQLTTTPKVIELKNSCYFGLGSLPRELSLFDHTYYLPDDLLYKVDIASMRSSLEVRVPLLDHNIVEFANTLPMSLRKNRDITKYLMKKVLFELLPAEFFNRKKQGFGFPIGHSLVNELRDDLEKYTSADAIESTELLNARVVASYKKRLLNGDQSVGKRLWSIIVLTKWLSKTTLVN